MTTVTVAEAKTHLSRLIAEAGGEVVIARGSKPAVRLVPVATPGKRQFAAQALTEHLVLLSSDSALDRFGVMRLWS